MWLREGAQGPIISQSVAPVKTDTQGTPSPVKAEEKGDAEVALEDATNVVPLHRKPDQAVKAKEEDKQQAKRAGPQEMIKVPADLLDGLVNLAGETSISRGRLENQVTDFGYSLEDMDATLDRLRDQLRRLDMETEAQVLFRREQQGPDYEDFDPLEMDRYSQLQ